MLETSVQNVLTYLNSCGPSRHCGLSQDIHHAVKAQNDWALHIGLLESKFRTHHRLDIRPVWEESVPFMLA